jgi:hypothetical protein
MISLHHIALTALTALTAWMAILSGFMVYLLVAG